MTAVYGRTWRRNHSIIADTRSEMHLESSYIELLEPMEMRP